MKQQTNVTPKKAFLRPLLMVVLWPAFLAAAVATGFFFSVVDPTDLVIFDRHISLSPMGAYTVGFIGFWLLGILSSALTALLLHDTR